MASFEFLAIILTGLGLTASVLYYSTILSNANKTQKMALETRQTQLFLQFYDTVNAENMQTVTEILAWEWEDYDDFLEKYYSPDLFSKYNTQFQRYNGIGLLAMRDQIDLDLVYQFVGSPIIRIWEKFKDIIVNRETYSGRMIGLEFLYAEMKKREQPNR